MRKITEAFKLKYDNIFAKLMNITVDELHFDKLKLNESICSNENAWQKHVTPESICKQMIDLYSFNNDDKILVLFNLELVKELIGRKVKKENIYFISDYSSKSEFLSKYFKGINYINLNEYSINDLEEKVKSFNVKKFDVVFSNPPYNDSIDLKIISGLKKYFSKAIIVHPAVWALENKNLGKFGKFKEEWKNNIDKIIIFNGTQLFNLPFMCPLDICVFNNNKINNIIEVNDSIVKSNYTVNNINDITIYGNMWFKLKINEFIKQFDIEKSILRHIYFDRDHLENLKYPIKLSECRSGNPYFNDGYYDEKLEYYVLNKSNCFFTCIAKGNPNQYHFDCDWNNPHNRELLFNFNTEMERYNFYNYAKTKIFRFLLSIYKINMQNSHGNPMKLIPWLDFSREWTDKDLCKEFNISKELWKYIDNFIPDYYDDYKSGF